MVMCFPKFPLSTASKNDLGEYTPEDERLKPKVMEVDGSNDFRDFNWVISWFHVNFLGGIPCTTKLGISRDVTAKFTESMSNKDSFTATYNISK